jgi:hypothetical protein
MHISNYFCFHTISRDTAAAPRLLPVPVTYRLRSVIPV